MALNPLASIGIGIGADLVTTFLDSLAGNEDTSDMENEQKNLADQAITGLKSTYADTVNKLNTTVQNNIAQLTAEFPAQASQIAQIYSASNPVIQADLQNLQATYKQNVDTIQQQIKSMHSNDIKDLATQFGNNGGYLSARLLGYKNFNEMQQGIAATTQMLKAAQPMQDLLGGIAQAGMQAQGTALQENEKAKQGQLAQLTAGTNDLSKELIGAQ